jgi:hypothetical protein
MIPDLLRHCHSHLLVAVVDLCALRSGMCLLCSAEYSPSLHYDAMFGHATQDRLAMHSVRSIIRSICSEVASIADALLIQTFHGPVFCSHAHLLLLSTSLLPTPLHNPCD